MWQRWAPTSLTARVSPARGEHARLTVGVRAIGWTRVKRLR